MATVPCSVFLEKHFQNGGVNRKGYDILNCAIRMISAVGWEIHVIVESEIATGMGMAVMEGHFGRILQVCEAFNKNMSQALKKAEWAANTLPDLEDEDATGDKLDDLLTTWRYKLRTLHTPTGNDTYLFQLIFLHYDTTVHQRLTELHHRRPGYRLGGITMRSSEVWHALKELYHIAAQADTIVSALKDQNQKALNSLPDDVLTIAFQASATSKEAIAALGNSLADAVYRPNPETVSQAQPVTSLSNSFGLAEAKMKHRRQPRGADSGDTGYTTANPESPYFQSEWTHRGRGQPHPSKDRAATTPRVFVESQTQLRKLRLSTVGSNMNQDTGKIASDVEVRDFAAPSRDTECTSPLPQSPLQRSDAFVSHETEVQDRVIRGEVVTTRRPSTTKRSRAKTVNEPRGDLEAWWKNPAFSSSQPPEAPDPHSNRKRTM